MLASRIAEGMNKITLEIAKVRNINPEDVTILDLYEFCEAEETRNIEV